MGFQNCFKENIILREENQKLKLANLILNDAEQENRRLRKLVSFKEKSELHFVAARIIASDSSNFRSSVVIDKGKKSGIEVGDWVISPDGLVGRVSELGNFASRVVLMNDPNFAVSAKIIRSGAMGLLTGSLDGNCILKYLELDDDIKIGDEVLTSTKESGLGISIPIGKVTGIFKEHSGISLFAVVKPQPHLNSLEEVLVIPSKYSQ